jgi:hypothetical protein
MIVENCGNFLSDFDLSRSRADKLLVVVCHEPILFAIFAIQTELTRIEA